MVITLLQNIAEMSTAANSNIII